MQNVQLSPQEFINGLKDQDMIMAFKDASHKFVAVSPYLARLYGKSAQELLGNTLPGYDQIDFENLSKNEIHLISVITDVYGKQKYVLMKRTRMTFNGETLYFHQGFTLTKQQSNQIATLLNESNKMINLKRNIPTTYLLNQKYTNHPFSYREQQCLFYMLRGKSANVISQILGLSRRTVEEYQHRIKSKLNCDTRTDLIELAIENGWLYLIPEGIYDFLPHGKNKAADDIAV